MTSVDSNLRLGDRSGHRLRFAGEGATVVATDANGDGLDALTAEQPSVTGLSGDLRDSTFIDSLVERAEALGPVHTLANVAGIMDHFVPRRRDR